MRVVILGGTQFIGRRISENLSARGDEVTVVHRGETEPAGLAGLGHLHCERASFSAVAGQVRALRPDAIVDCTATTAGDVAAVLPHLPDAQLVVLSSQDVYAAFSLANAGAEGVGLPITETSPIRPERFPHRGLVPGREDYDKLDVEPRYTERGGTVLRLPMVYGEHDPQRREEFVLRRVRAGRTEIPVGSGSWLWTRCYCGDVAAAVLAALGNSAAAGQIFNVGDVVTRSIRGWAEMILTAAGHPAELVQVPEAEVPADLWITRNVPQHVLADSGKLQRDLGWQPAPVPDSIERSVRWHLANPPEAGQDGPDDDFAADDKALAAR